MMMKRVGVIGLVCALALAGCGSVYGGDYTRTATADDLTPPVYRTEVPRLMASAGTMRDDVERLWAEGYVTVGYSWFEGRVEHDAAALAQAKMVGADIVVLTGPYRASVTRTAPATRTLGPVTSPLCASLNATSTGSGSLDACLDRSGEVEGWETVEIPYRQDTLQRLAMYFARGERKGAGLLVAAPGVGADGRAGVVDGVVVRAVRNGSPAATAGFRAGDLLQTVDGLEVRDGASFRRAVRSAYGHMAVYRARRGDHSLEFNLALLKDGSWPSSP